MLTYELPNIGLSGLAGSSGYSSSPWRGYHKRHLILLANRHKLHKYNLPQTIVDENGKVALRHANGHLTRYTDRMANAFNLWLLIWLQYLAYCWKRLSGTASNYGKMQKSLEAFTSDFCHENPVREKQQQRNGKNGKNGFHYNNNHAHHDGVNVDINKLNKRNNGALIIKPKIRSVTNHHHKNGYFMKKKAEIELDEVFEKLKVAEQAAFSLIPFARCNYDEDYQKDYEYEPENLLEKACETSYITAVFEVQNRGLKDIVAGISREMSEWYDQGLVIVCCELVWSVPFKHRDIGSEVRLKNDVLRALRYNNRRVLDEVDKKNVISEKDKKMIIFPESMIEEVAGRKEGCYMGSYRRYYDGLLPYQHNDTQDEHGPYWSLDKKKLPEDVKWPIIASQTKTSFLMLNLICLRFDQL